MKAKLISVFLIVVFLCSCSKTQQLRFEPEKYIDSDFSIQTGDYKINGNVKIFSYEDIVFSFTYPEALSYLTMRVSSEGYFADIGGNEDEIFPEELPDNAPVKLFAESLKAFLFEQNEFTKSETGEYLCESLILGQAATATFGTDGKITKINCGNINISLTTLENSNSVG